MSSRQLGRELGEAAKMAFTNGWGTSSEEHVLVYALGLGVEMDWCRQVVEEVVG
jgi:hypothetical protein